MANIFNSINLWTVTNDWAEAYDRGCYYVEVFEDGTEEYHALTTGLLRSAKDLVSKIIDRKIRSTWKDWSEKWVDLCEIYAMTDIYLELRSRIKGKGSKQRKDELAIQFLSYAFKTAGFSVKNPEDVASMELLTGLDMHTGDMKKEERDKRFPKPKRERCYLVKHKQHK